MLKNSPSIGNKQWWHGVAATCWLSGHVKRKKKHYGRLLLNNNIILYYNNSNSIAIMWAIYEGGRGEEKGKK